MREVIIGADGFIGASLARHLPNATKTTRRHAYLNGAWLFDMLDSGTPLPDADVVYICAGINGTLNCARDPQQSFRVNVDGTIGVAERYAQPANAFVVWISSTTVEWCLEHYAIQKRTTETVLRTMPHVGIIRAGRALRSNVDDLCRTMIDMGRSKKRGVRLWGEDEKPYEHGLAAVGG